MVEGSEIYFYELVVKLGSNLFRVLKELETELEFRKNHVESFYSNLKKDVDRKGLLWTDSKYFLDFKTSEIPPYRKLARLADELRFSEYSMLNSMENYIKSAKNVLIRLNEFPELKEIQSRRKKKSPAYKIVASVYIENKRGYDNVAIFNELRSEIKNRINVVEKVRSSFKKDFDKFLTDIQGCLHYLVVEDELRRFIPEEQQEKKEELKEKVDDIVEQLAFVNHDERMMIRELENYVRNANTVLKDSKK